MDIKKIAKRAGWPMSVFAIFYITSLPGSRAVAQIHGPTVLNHVYVVLDSVTFEAVRTSEFLRNQFAISSQPIDSAVSKRSRSTLYLTGRSTYLELFGPDAMVGPIGLTGLAYGFDEPGKLEWARDRWEQMLGVRIPIRTRSFTRQDGSEGAWYRHVSLPVTVVDTTDSGSIGVWTWAMEYSPGFLHERLGEPEEVTFVTRERYLRAWSAFRHRVGYGLMEDIIGLTLAVPPNRVDPLLAELAAIGFSTSEDGDSRVAQGNGFQIRVVPEEQGRRGLKATQFRLRTPISPRSHVVGNSIITIHPDETATWTLELSH